MSNNSIPHDWIIGAGEPAIHVFTNEEIQPHVEAQFGGDAWAQEGWEWPRDHNDRPLSLLARIDLASVQYYLPTSWLPSSGMLLFFYDTQGQPWGFDPKERLGWRVVYVPEDTVGLIHSPPVDAISFPSRVLGFCPIETYREGLIPAIDLDEEQYEQLEEFVIKRNYQDMPAHQILGQALPVQDQDMEAECQLASHGVFAGTPLAYETDSGRNLLADPSVNDWALLLQLDSDDEMGWMWGDSGMLYFFVQRDRARQGNFDHAWVVLQCC